MKPQKQFFIVNSLTLNKGKILLVRRKREWHKEAHNKWELPGGKIDFGENPETTAIRETLEESGYKVEVLSLLPKIISAKWEFEDRESQQILICYLCKLKGGTPSEKDHGVSKVKWFTPEEALKLECLPGTKEFIKLYKN